MVEVSLYQMCLSKIANMILTNYLKTDTSPNPFLNCPPSVVNDLIERVCSDIGGPFKSSYLHLLLASGRVQDFKLNNLVLETNDAEDIFRDLRSSEKILKSIKIQDVFLEGSEIVLNLGRLINASKSLTSVETCIGFPLSDLYYSKSLKELNLHYVIRDSLKYYSELRMKPHYNNSLRVLKLFKGQSNSNLRREIADIMEYCLELVEIDYDLTQTLEYIYEKNKSQKYQLQKTILGSDAGCFSRPANERAVIIASYVCPDLQSVEITPEDYSSILALSHFRCITALVISAQKFSVINYRVGVHPLLEIPEFGTRLTSLTLLNVSAMDFTSIGICCLNLELLNVEYYSANNASNLPQNAFRKLGTLYLKKMYSGPCEDSTLCTILSNASALEYLKINFASTLTDTVLDAILENNDVLSILKLIRLGDCGLTITGLKKLAQRAKSLKNVHVSSRFIPETEARSVLYNISPEYFVWTE